LSLVCGFFIGLCGMAALANLGRVDRSSGAVSTRTNDERGAGSEQTDSTSSSSVAATTVVPSSSTSSTDPTTPRSTTSVTATTLPSTTTASSPSSVSTTTTTTIGKPSSASVAPAPVGGEPTTSTTVITTLPEAETSTTSSTTSTSIGVGPAGLDDPVVTPVPTPPEGWPVHAIVFPVVGPVSYDDSWGAYRESIETHFHVGVDLIGARLQPIVAVSDGIVKRFVNDHPTAGWGIVLTGSDGWEYRYYHLNNDTPGTDDGTNPGVFRFAPGLVPGDRVRAGQLIGYMGDSGDSETSVPHLHFEIRRPDDSAVNPFPSVRAAELRTRCAPPENFGLPADLQYPLDTDAQVVEFPASEGKGSFILSGNGTVFLTGSARSIGQASHAKADGPCAAALTG
jgi:murein DD-endopeptidase MepM/ murein hydrolase activator NlpD